MATYRELLAQSGSSGALSRNASSSAQGQCCRSERRIKFVFPIASDAGSVGDPNAVFQRIDIKAPTRRGAAPANNLDAIFSARITVSADDYPGQLEMCNWTSNGRRWCLTNVTVTLKTASKTQSGMWTVLALDPREAALASQGVEFEDYPGARTAAAAEDVSLEVTQTTFQTWALASGLPNGMLDCPFLYTPEEWLGKLSRVDRTPLAVLVRAQNIAPLVKDDAVVYAGDLIVWATVQIEGTPAITQVERSLKPADFFGLGKSGGGTTDGGVRSRSGLTVSPPALVDAAGVIHVMTTARDHRLLEFNWDLWRKVIRPSGAYRTFTFPKVFTAFATKGKQILQGMGLLDDMNEPNPMEGWAKPLLLDGSDPDYLTELAPDALALSRADIYDGNGLLFSRAAVFIHPKAEWEAYGFFASSARRRPRADVNGFETVTGIRSSPAVGIKSFHVVPAIVVDNSEVTNMVTSINGMTANVGDFAGDYCVAAGQGKPGTPATMGTLMNFRSQQAASRPTGLIDGVKWLAGCVSSATSVVGSLASTVVNALTADATRRAEAIQLIDACWTPEAEKDVVTTTQKCGFYQPYFSTNYVNYDPAAGYLFGVQCGASGPITAKTPLVHVEASAKATISFMAFEEAEAQLTVISAPIAPAKRRERQPDPGPATHHIICPGTGQSLRATIVVDAYISHSLSGFALDENLGKHSPATTLAVDTFGQQQSFDLITCIDCTGFRMQIAGASEHAVQSYCCGSVEATVAIDKIFPWPEAWYSPDGTKHMYGPDDKVSFALVLVPRFVVDITHDHSMIDGRLPDEQVYWRPANFAVSFHVPAEINAISGAIGNGVVGNPKTPGEDVYPVWTANRRIIQDATITVVDSDDDAGGINWSDFSFNVSNVRPGLNTARPSA
jgi:hypothetical protein